MNVIVIEKRENFAVEETFSVKVGTTTISTTGKIYHEYTSILGVYASTDAAIKALENEKMKILDCCGAKALDDENIGDMHTFYTFATISLEVEGNDNEN